MDTTLYVFVDSYRKYETFAYYEDDLSEYYKFETYEDVMRAKIARTKKRYEIAEEELKRYLSYKEKGFEL